MLGAAVSGDQSQRGHLGCPLPPTQVVRLFRPAQPCTHAQPRARTLTHAHTHICTAPTLPRRAPSRTLATTHSHAYTCSHAHTCTRVHTMYTQSHVHTVTTPLPTSTLAHSPSHTCTQALMARPWGGGDGRRRGEEDSECSLWCPLQSSQATQSWGSPLKQEVKRPHWPVHPTSPQMAGSVVRPP
jgi:hypothetical protein